jgi:hypothetical protein
LCRGTVIPCVGFILWLFCCRDNSCPSLSNSRLLLLFLAVKFAH